PSERRLCRLYWRKDEELLLAVYWTLGTGEYVQRRVMPAIDLKDSSARFSSPRIGDLDFTLQPVPAPELTDAQVVRLVVAEGEQRRGELAQDGAWGRIRLCCDGSVVEWRALLLGSPNQALTCVPVNRALRKRSGPLPIYERGPEIAVPMLLSA